jgi:hypothetical protein
MKADARYKWKHSIPNESLLSPKRISITFREIRQNMEGETLLTLDKWTKKEEAPNNDDQVG